MEATEYPKTLKAVTNGTKFLTISNSWDEAKNALLFNIEESANRMAAKLNATVVDFQVIGRNEVTMARIVRDPFTGEVSEA